MDDPLNLGDTVRWVNKAGDNCRGSFLGAGYKGNLSNGIHTYAIVVKIPDGHVLEMPFTALQFVRNDP